jgi:flagellar hook protein FlgE
MSIFGAMNTAISGLDAQASQFANISDNMANSQTVGYKSIGTNFIDYLTSSTLTENQSGSVAARPDYENDLQGSIAQSTDPLSLAITGGGFFDVAEQDGTTSTGGPAFSTAQYYTRTGDFTQNAQGYLQNSAGEYLEGWLVDPATGKLNTSATAPIQVSENPFAPIATSTVSLQENVPAVPTSSSNLTSEVQIYDATGAPHELTMTWTPVPAAPATAGPPAVPAVAPNTWDVAISAPDSSPATLGSATVVFNADDTIASVTADPSSTNVATGTSSTQADLTLTPIFNGVTQSISLNLGDIGTSDGVTQYAGTDLTVRNTTQNGVPPGSFTGITTSAEGDISANYNNGQSVRLARVPLSTFADPDALQRENGQAFMADINSGAAQTQSAGDNGAGGLVVGSVENSNVDIASQLATMIVAQQAYGANAKVITTANELLTTTLDMKQ